jgi:hypothetical protein
MAWRGDRIYPRGRASGSNFNACQFCWKPSSSPWPAHGDGAASGDEGLRRHLYR